MVNAYETGKVALESLLGWLAAQDSPSAERNEATTRLHLVDVLLEQCLGWPKDQIETEHAQDTTFTDYVLGRPVHQAVVEAKRETASFALPAGTDAGVFRIEDLTDGPGGRALRAAMAQVSAYCAIRGVPVGIVCNGRQLVAFLAVRTDGVPPLSGRALAFPSLESMRENFRLLWDNLSRPGIAARTLFLTLRKGSAVPPPEPLSARLVGYPGNRQRNLSQKNLASLSDLIVDELGSLEDLRHEFLTTCYATSGALSQYADLSRQIIQARYVILEKESDGFDIDPATTKRGISENFEIDIYAAALSKRPIVLLGDVGVGKTMFIQHLINVDAPEIFQHAITLYIDFARRPALEREIEEFITGETVRQLSDKHKIDILDTGFMYAVYAKELARFDRGIHGALKNADEETYEAERYRYVLRLSENMATHLERSLHHLSASTRRHVIIFLDNVDIRNSEFQEHVYVTASALASSWPATVFVSLRSDTFYTSRKNGAPKGHRPRVFTISPPRVDVVLRKRLEFAKRHLIDRSTLPSLPPGTTVKSPTLNAYLAVLTENFRSNDRLIRLVDNLSGGNIGLALDFLRTFIGSGHISPAKIVAAYDREGEYAIPVHEFLRALMFGKHEYFNPSHSPIANIFDISSPDGREHFLAAILIAFAHATGEASGGAGLISTEDLFAHAQAIGFDEGQIKGAIDRAVAGRLLEASPGGVDTSRSQYFRVTTVGVYTTRVLATLFAYVDAVIVGTPIVDKAYRRHIGDARSLADRATRANYFGLFLDAQWAALAKAGGLSFDWQVVSEQLARDIEQVTALADPEATNMPAMPTLASLPSDDSAD